jgi:hypothetical protein
VEIGQDGNSFFLDGGIDGLEFFNDGLMGFGFSLLEGNCWFWAMLLDQFAFGDHSLQISSQIIILLFIDAMLLLVIYANVYIHKMQEVKLKVNKYFFN